MFPIHRVKYKRGMVFLSSIFFCALITALSNLAIALFYVKDVYLADPSGTMSMIEDPLALAIEISTLINMNLVLGYLATGAVFGALAGVVLGFVICFTRCRLEARRCENAEDIRASLSPVRHIIADGYAVASEKIPSTGSSKSKGTLFLTDTTLEFYDRDYTTAQKNFLIKLSDITSVRATTCLLCNNKITVVTTKASYTFMVPIGTAKDWKKFIKAAI